MGTSVLLVCSPVRKTDIFENANLSERIGENAILSTFMLSYKKYVHLEHRTTFQPQIMDGFFSSVKLCEVSC